MEINRNIVYRTHFELVDTLLNIYLIAQNIKLQEKQRKLLSVYIIKGISREVDELVIKKKIFVGINIIKKYRYELQQKGLIVKHRYKHWSVAENIALLNNQEFNFNLKMSYAKKS